MGERSSEPTLRIASSTPGMNDSRVIESCLIESVWPRPPKTTSWCATRPGQPDRVDRLVHVAAGLADQVRGALGGARRRVELAVVVQLDDLALGHVRGDELRGLHHQDGADREVGRHEQVRRADALELREVGAGRAHHAVDAGLEAGAGVGERGVGLRRSRPPRRRRRARPRARCRARGSARPTSSMSSAASTAPQTVSPIRPAAPGDRDADHAAAASAGLTCSSAPRNTLLVRPHAGGRQPLGVEQLAGQRGHVLGRAPRRSPASTSSRDSSGTPVRTELPSRFMRASVDSIASVVRPLTFSRARSSSAAGHVLLLEPAQLAADGLERLAHAVRPRADVEADLARVDVLAGVRVDRVGQPALLAHLLEQPRGGRAAEDRVEHAQGEAPLVGARNARAAEADVELLGVLVVEADPRACASAGAGSGSSRPSPVGRGPSSAPSTSSTIRSCSRLPAAATTMLGAV